MKYEEGTYQSSPTQPEYNSNPTPPVRQPNPARRRRILAALILLVVCIVGASVFFLLPKGGQSQQPNTTAPAVYNWCTQSGAQTDASKGQLSLNGIVTLSDKDAWTLGSIGQGKLNENSSNYMPVMQHWNGSQWQVVATADTSALLSDLTGQVQGASNQSINFGNDLGVVSPNDIWVVGEVNVTQFSQTSGQVTHGHTLAEHWDGSKWTLVQTPDGGQDGKNSLYSVSAVAANNAWAVGYSGPSDGDGSKFVPLVEHWDGSQWQTVQMPDPLQHGFLNIVRAISANDVWAFGATVTPPIKTLAAHWDGNSWTSVDLPKDFVAGNFFNVAAISSNDIWAIGSSPANSSLPLIAHYDGKTWTSSSPAAGTPSGSRLAGITGTGANDVWAVGTTSDNKPLVEHWDGSAWTLRSPSTPANGSLTGVAVSGGKIWIVGLAYQDASGATVVGPVIEQHC